MATEQLTITVDSDSYDGRLDTPSSDTDRAILVLPGAGHGPFGDVFDRFVDAATEAGYAVARFETWQGPDELRDKSEQLLEGEVAAELAALDERGYNWIGVVAKSFGGRLALQYAVDGADRLVLWAPAIVFDGAPDVPSITAEELATIDRPITILQGDADEVVSVENARSLVEHLPDGDLVELAGEDHSFQHQEERIVQASLAALGD